MAEELLVKCRKCGLVYDKLRNRGCPKCEPRIRPGSAPPAEPSAGPDTRTAGTAADGGAAAARPTVTIPRPPVPRTALALLVGAAVGFGGARFLAARVAREPVLLPLPAASTPAATGRAPAATAQGTGMTPAAGAAGSAPAAAPGPIDRSLVTGADGKAPAHPIELLDARRGVPQADGTLEYTAVLVNRTSSTAKEMRVRGLGEDKKGNQVVTEEVAVEPGLVGAGREASARLVVPEGTILREYSVTAWFQHGAMVRVEASSEVPAAAGIEAKGKRGGTLRPFPPSTVPEPGDVEPSPDPEATPADPDAG